MPKAQAIGEISISVFSKETCLIEILTKFSENQLPWA